MQAGVENAEWRRFTTNLQPDLVHWMHLELQLKMTNDIASVMLIETSWMSNQIQNKIHPTSV